MDKKYHWFVSYSFHNEGSSGFGSIEITSDEDLFIPSDIQKYISHRNKTKVVILNWKSLDANQLVTITPEPTPEPKKKAKKIVINKKAPKKKKGGFDDL